MLRIITFILLYFSAWVSLTPDLNVYALYFAIPLSTFLSFHVGGNCFKGNPYIKLLLTMYIWIAITALFAYNEEATIRDMRAVLGAVLLTISFANLVIKKNNIIPLYIVFIILYIAAIRYALDNIFSMQFDYRTDRLNDRTLNANTIAYYTFFVTFSIFMLGEMARTKKWRIFFDLTFFLMIVISFVIAILTASRQVLIIQIPLIAILLYIRYFKNSGSGRKIAMAFALIFVFVISIDSVMDVYDNSLLNSRSQTKVEDDSRFAIMLNAFEVAVDHPVLGVGPGNYIFFDKGGLFSHNTYLELFANSGLLALILYIALLYKYCKNQWNIYRKSKDRIVLAFFFFGIIYAIDNMFFVFYNALWLMGFFILVSSHSLTYEKGIFLKSSHQYASSNLIKKT